MDSDADVSRWVLELLLRDRHNDTVAKRLLAAAPLSTQDSRLNKTLLLRTIESQIFDEASVTEPILDSLDSIAALDRREGIPITDAMKAAYCAVATECTVKFLVCGGGTKPSGKYVAAVERIWRARVRALEESEGCEMVTAELRERRDEVEAGVWDVRVSKRLASLNSRNEALRLVAVYVKEALAMMGPPFIAWAIRFSMQNGGLGLGGDEIGVGNDVNLSDRGDVEVLMVNEIDLEAQNANGVNAGSELEAQKVNGANNVSDRCEQEAQRANGANVSDASGQKVQDNNVGDESELQIVPLGYFSSRSEKRCRAVNGVQLQVGAGKSPPSGNRGVRSSEPTKGRETQRGRALRRRHGPVKIRDTEEDMEPSDDMHNTVSSAEVRKVQEELESSVSALKALVVDPLSYALPVSEVVRSELGMRPVDHVSGENGGAVNPSVQKKSEPDQSNNDNHGNQTSHQNVVPQPSGKEHGAANLSVDKGKGTEYDRMGDINPGNPSCSYKNNVSRASFMEHNSTAHTYQWDVSLGMSPEKTNGRRLRSPKRVSKRRKIKKWSEHEEDTLRTGVQKYGKGNWKLILETYRDVFEERTEVDLKDKWRNMMRYT